MLMARMKYASRCENVGRSSWGSAVNGSATLAPIAQLIAG